MKPSAPCPRCGTRCVVTTAHSKSCLACGHEQRDLPIWLATAPTGAFSLPTDRRAFDDDDEERLAR